MSKITRALVSVSDKNGILDLARFLVDRGVELLSTGGTAKAIRDAGLPVKDVSEHTGFPEMMDGRVKTLHPRIHGGLLGLRDHPEHQAAMAEHNIAPIDMVVVNLYPFEATVAKADCSLIDAIENIDIGGPSMLRSAAKNHRFVTVVVDPSDYTRVMEEMGAADGAVGDKLRFELACKVFAHTARYDGAIANYFTSLDAEGKPQRFPSVLTQQWQLARPMRYGENPHQSAAFYVAAGMAQTESSISSAVQLQGKELSFNNINDTNGAFELVKEFSEPSVVIVKHANPCGVAIDQGSQLATYLKARDCDPVSAFGGIVAFNRPLDGETAAELATTFLEVIVAPGFSAEAKAILGEKKNLRLLQTPEITGAHQPEFDLKKVVGGLLVQDRDLATVGADDLKTVTELTPDAGQIRDLLFAWKVVKHVKSNAIVYVKDGVTVGIGAGQMSRVDSAKIAVSKAQSSIEGAVMASDAFFPFRDGIDAAAAAGIKAVIQPGGSIRDEEVVGAANEHGMAMVFTGVRHFKH
ncbi:MAG: bifunctional phosphoribosylaminoimidazolecarboxamide formyltransferase/inosine monophosphate cyclohydrolase [Alphaproteobacteria bacterium CG_4_10_14_0_2_um_filter_63_37]|nr:MAG: bifunctional phosphoribosylaminoimidazolecarboxamide formyltransferase/IMP cyclohydrolase [Proteobacteria bacterium CG1_02_64_396]PJA25163.1 MAG: bifunctional phosphoribosylaminoimidazolecarboxamide formyltransferase/inosine monophosphate cyclohydrolase [Alphaproteobacteria bacterium CG_4_10_14_0_2_um_filter_63_37]